MQIAFNPARRNNPAFALMIVLCSLAAMLLVFASIMYWMSGNSLVTARNNQFFMSEIAAEAATEEVISKMNYDYISQSLSNSTTYYATQFLPSLTNEQKHWPIQYVYSDTNGVSNQISINLGPWTTNTVPLTSQYTNLYGLEQNCTVTATATPIGQQYNVPATVSETIQFAAIPLFQFAVFYNMNLEIDPGAAMTIEGAVWSNGGIWSGTPNVSYTAMVGAVGKVYYAPNNGTDPFDTNKVDSGGASGGTPIGNFAAAPTSGNDIITMPIGTNNNPATVAALINLPPTNTYALGTLNAYSTNGQVYFANSADLYLTNFGYGINPGSYPPHGSNMVLYYQDVDLLGTIGSYYMTNLPYDFFICTNRAQTNIFTTNFLCSTASSNTFNVATNVWYAGYSWLTNVVFYDWREGWNGGSGPPKAVQAVQIDFHQFNVWLTNSTANSNGGSVFNNLCTANKAHPIDSIYIYNGVPLTGTTLPAVRIYNGGMLPTQTAPKGFTVATAMPLYVYGDLNASNNLGSSLGKNTTTYTWPCGLIGDAITILSDNWNDSTTTKLPTPTTTTVNSAMVEGIVQSTNGIYCGGLENFLRLLENWSSSVPLWYNGSIVVMFPSQIATNYQQTTGNYYNAPARNWAFDTNFAVQVGLPPLTPQCKGVIRTNWNVY
jgi:hypothetical protein